MNPYWITMIFKELFKKIDNRNKIYYAVFFSFDLIRVRIIL